MSTPDPVEERLAALARQIERLARQSGKHDTHLRELAGRILAQHSPTTPAHTDGEEFEELPAWLTMTDFPEASAGLEALTDWLAEVYLRFPDAALRECWAWHPHVVGELWWLHQAWRDAHTGERASWMKVGDWHDRQRPGVVRRVNAALKLCGLDKHTSPTPQDTPRLPLAGALPHVLTAWLGANRSTWPPQPTAAQLDEAHNLEQRRLSTNRSRR
jgi:hypothetical protein